MNTIRQKHVKARKPHHCDLCGCVIQKGEVYEHQVNVSGGDVYDFKAHLHCQDLSSAIWNYVDPDEGMTDAYFQDAVQSLADTFYCRFHCDKWNKEKQECECRFSTDTCVKAFAKFMETRELFLVKDPNVGMCWRLCEKEKGD